MTATFTAGFALGFSLILAIGSQNAFVLRQGLRREHVFAILATCAISDAILIAAGVGGFGALASAVPLFEVVMRYGGAAFLVWYGMRNLISAYRGGGNMGNAKSAGSLRAALITCLLLTWANPHVYLDTVVLLGSISAQYDDKIMFAAGAMTSSFVFFFSLGYGARLLGPLFDNPTAWRVLDLLVAVTMFIIAASLVF